MIALMHFCERVFLRNVAFFHWISRERKDFPFEISSIYFILYTNLIKRVKQKTNTTNGNIAIHHPNFGYRYYLKFEVGRNKQSALSILNLIHLRTILQSCKNQSIDLKFNCIYWCPYNFNIGSDGLKYTCIFVYSEEVFQMCLTSFAKFSWRSSS